MRIAIIIFVLILNFISVQAKSINKLQEVSIQLQWLDQFQFAGYYIAKEKGFYTDVGLDVKLIAFNNSINTSEEVRSGRAMYGIGRSSLLINKQDIVLLSAIFQSSPYILLSTPKSNIKTIKDFKNKTIMLTKDTEQTAAFIAMLESSHINLNQLNIIDHTFDVNDLIDAKTDIMAAYTTNEPFILKEKGIKTIIFDPKNYGFDLYSDILFTSKDEKTNNPQRVYNMIDATNKGWEYAFNHINESVDLIINKYNTQNKSKEALLFEAEELKKLAYSNTSLIGHIDKQKIQRIHDMYNIMGMTKTTLDLDTFVYDFHHDKLHLTNKENSYIKNDSNIKVCTHPFTYPLDMVINSHHTGITGDIFHTISDMVNIQFTPIESNSNDELDSRIANNECDIISTIIIGQNRFQNFSPTNAFIEDYFSIITSVDKVFIENTDELDNKHFIVTDKMFKEQIQKVYPYMNIKIESNMDKAIDSIINNKTYGIISPSMSSNRIIEEYDSSKLKVSGFILKNNPLKISIGVSKEKIELIDILNKALNAIDKKEIQKIKNKWKVLKYKSKLNYEIIITISALYLIIFIILIVAYIKQSKLRALLETQKQLYNLVYQNSSNAVLIYDIYDKKFIDCNNQTLVMLNAKSKNDILKSDPSFLYSEDVVDSTRRNYLNIIMDTDTFDFDWKHKRFNGETFWTNVVLTKINLNNRDMLHIVWKDIDHKIKMEQKLIETLNVSEILFNEGMQGIIVWDSDYKVIKANLFAIKLFNYTEENIVGKYLFDFIDSKYHTIVREALEMDTSIPYETELIRDDGSKFFVYLYGTNIIYDNKKARVSFFVDLTEIKSKEILLYELNNTLEHKISKAIKETKEKEKLLQKQIRLAQMGEMISMIAHQWRQPLNSISASAIKLSMQEDLGIGNSKDIVQQSNFIQTQSQIMSKTINDFMNFFKEDKETTLINMNVIKEELESLIVTQLKNNGIVLIYKQEKKINFNCYKNELLHVLINLISNSRDAYIENKSIKSKEIILEIKRKNKLIEITILDHAGGIDEKIIDRVFDLYFTTKEQGKGTGIGLFMSSRIAKEVLNGTLSVKNVNNGSSFTITLPEN